MKKLSFIIVIVLTLIQTIGQVQIDSNYINAIKWRMIGPHRGGRTVGAVGVPQEPNVFSKLCYQNSLKAASYKDAS